ncbi:hypothetical protein ACWD5R_34280 [Streptomyces sp. NPDC002514]|uniref:hypothetical protein n=1 Tax=Streptomyces sp. NPDC001270 TaxID=3364554 RepID=UPI0036C94F72
MSDEEWPDDYEEGDTAGAERVTRWGWKATATVVARLERFEPDTMRAPWLHTTCRPPLAHHARRHRLRT